MFVAQISISFHFIDYQIIFDFIEIPCFVYLLISQKAFGLFSLFDYYE